MNVFMSFLEVSKCKSFILSLKRCVIIFEENVRSTENGEKLEKQAISIMPVETKNSYFGFCCLKSFLYYTYSSNFQLQNQIVVFFLEWNLLMRFLSNTW